MIGDLVIRPLERRLEQLKMREQTPQVKSTIYSLRIAIANAAYFRGDIDHDELTELISRSNG